jgi:hypothetical protein
MLVAESSGHMCLRSPDMAKLDPSAADVALAVWNGYVRDDRRHAHQWRPVEQVLQGSKGVGLGARARSRSSLCESSSVYLVDLVLVQRCMLLLKNCEYI